MSSHQEYSDISSVNLTTEFNDSTHNFHLATLPRQIFLLLFPFMVIIGVVCNTLIFVIMRRRRMSHLSTCYYMGILAIADTSVLLLGLSVMWLYFVKREWSLLLQSTYACKFLSLLFYTVADVSVWLVCMMSADRCIAVTRPLHASSICTVRRARICVIILVLCIILINIHFLFTHHLSIDNDCTHHEYYESFNRHIWPWIDAAVYSVLPFILLLTMNLIIVHSLFQARRSTSNLQIYQSQITRHKNKLSTTMSRKLTTMLLAVTVFFLLSSFPMVCLQIYTATHKKHQVFTTFYLKPLCETLQYSNHCINFFLYAMTGKAFRLELKRLFHGIIEKIHFSKDPIPKSTMDRRTTTFNINYLAGEPYFDHRRLKERRSSPATIQLIRTQPSIDSTMSNGNTIYRHLRQQQQVQKNLHDVTYYFQRISNV